MRGFFGLAIMLAFCSCNANAMDAKQARYEAQKLYTYLEKNNGFAFIDVVLNDEAKYSYHMGALKTAMQAAPVSSPEFSPFKACVNAAENLSKFAELRRIGKGQNEQSDTYRRPFWDALSACKRSLEKP